MARSELFFGLVWVLFFACEVWGEGSTVINLKYEQIPK